MLSLRGAFRYSAWAFFALTPFASFAADFRTDVYPILQRSCAGCHLGGNAMGKLQLESEADVLRGGASGPGLIEGNSKDSVLIKRILGSTDAPRMPMGGKPLPAEDVTKLRAWIDALYPGQIAHAASTAPASAAEKVADASNSPAFASTVRPILASRCYSCHGASAQQNGLRLDSLAAILKGGDTGKVVVPGKSQSSRLMRRLLAQDRPRMPYDGPALSQAEIASIRQWIDAGAPGPDSDTPLQVAKAPKHWSYVAPVRPAVPAVKEAAWPRNPIDNFILAKLEAEHLKPAREASKPALLRRVYLDLTGLPPSPAEVDAFLSDKSPEAYEKVVDRLQASPRYGERWARPWLDLARYADSNGYEKDRRRTAWEYRDWVIRALNQDMPFSQFTIEQMAGDMLPNPSNEQLVATGFNRNSMLNQEGGIDIQEYYWLSQVDRVNTTASVWLGSTMACAQCHNHKFDPFPHKDYYRFLAFFNNSEHFREGKDVDFWMAEPELPLPNAEQDKQSKAIHAKMDQLKTVLDSQTPDLDKAQQNWERRMAQVDSEWSPVQISKAESAGGATLKVQPDASLLASGKNPQADTYTVAAQTGARTVTGVRIEVLPDPGLPKGGPGRDAEGNFFLSDFDLQVVDGSSASPQIVMWKSVLADESQTGYDAKSLIGKKTDQLVGWAIETGEHNNWRRQAVFIPKEPLQLPAGSTLSFRLSHQMRHSSRNIGRFRISLTSSGDPEFGVKFPAALRSVLAVDIEKRTPDQRKQMSAAFRSVAPELDPVRKEMAGLEKDLQTLGIPTAMVMRELPGTARPSTPLRERGTYTSPGEVLEADVPSAFNPLPKDFPPNRLGLARWLVSRENPLTARVTVNHFWETLLGRGIVETSEDFGSQGDAPTHPELLDWLATEFMENGWSMKRIQKLIVMSATYRQDSHVSAELNARDPYNHLYARGPRFRVESEMVHDVVLAESGLLSSKMYGPSVFPYQPEGVWDIPYSSDKWMQSDGEDRFRRSVYTFIRRSAPYPSLVTFDATSRELCTVRRVRTNTPLQALTGLNDPFFFEAARAMAKRMNTEGGSSAASQIGYGFRLVTSRPPTEMELANVLAFYDTQLGTYQKDTAAAIKTIGGKLDEQTDAAKLAALTMAANVLLNMDESVTLE